MKDHYRSAALHCPNCEGILDETATEVALVDVCADCGGIWIDWFDGEVHDVAASAAELAGPGRTGRRLASRSCPHCNVSLEEEPFRGKGPEILWCSQCQGAFVPRSSLDEVLAMGPADVVERAAAQGLWDRIRAVLGKAFSRPNPAS